MGQVVDASAGRISRRHFVAAAVIAACGRSASQENAGTAMIKPPADRSTARLAARPRVPSLQIGSGLKPLELTRGPRDGLIYVPAGYQWERPTAFALLLHGAGGSAQDVVANSGPLADATGTIILAVDSRLQTWDVLRGGYGPDVAFIDRSLEWAFAHCAVDRSRVAVGGFSDGASYALSVGLANGDLFTHVLAFSPGFALPPAVVGKPQIFMSHGTEDQILPIDSTSRIFVPQLRRAGYQVRYREFVGPHTVPLDVAKEALAWFSAAE